ncbi:SLBB domain-containing protein [Hahella sp. NBU794]|uniref:polysaccharide biosynthesis/export family protein n=1 Tax=Hahella sp. NBU794 TaxID=3422590 RepID=UPI003D6E04E8
MASQTHPIIPHSIRKSEQGARLTRLTIWLTALIGILLTCRHVGAEETAAPLQPGDQLYLGLTGEQAFNRNFPVDREGRILLPEAGPVKIAGQSLSAATQMIQLALGQVYRDVERLQVTLAERNLIIDVSGYVENPGSVLTPIAGDVQTAITLAGGLLPGAQLDRMQIQRGDDIIYFSYKAYLDSGDRSSLPPLRSLDRLFIPASPLIGNVQIDFDAQTLAASGDASDDRQAVRIFGEVKSPGRFNYEPDYSVIDAIMRAGGVTRYAAVEQIKIISDSAPYNFNLKRYLESGDASLLPQLKPNSTIFVPIQQDEIKAGANVVYVMGEVFKPGAFEGKPGATLLDIMANAGGPTRFAESRQIRILKADGAVIPFDLQAYTEGVSRVALPEVAPGDAVFVPEKTDVNEASWLKTPPDRAVEIIGQVYNPGRFEWSDEMTLMDLLGHAQGPTARADIANIKIMRRSGDKVLSSTFNLDRFIKYGGDLSEIPQLDAGTSVIIPELPQDPSDNKAQWVRQAKENSIYIMGQVGAPGRYMFNEEMTFLDILSAADGPNGSADIHNIRVVHRDGAQARISKLNLALYFETGDQTLLPVVKPGDSIFVPEKDRNWLEESKENTVRVLGSVNKPGRYRFSDDMTVLDLLAQAGGATASAYIERIVVVNTSCCADSASSFDLESFVKEPDMSKLPVLRPGDTLYIPDKSDSHWATLSSSLEGVFKIISVVGIIGAL